MKFKIGYPGKEGEFNNNQHEWKQLKNLPNSFSFKIMTLFISIFISVLLYQCIKDIIPVGDIIKGLKRGYGLFVFIVIPIHECMHALMHPSFGLSDKTTIGLWPKKFVFYTYYDGVMKRSRWILTALSPFIFLTILPILLIHILNINYPALAFIALFNAAAGAGDMFYSILIIIQIPKTALVKSDTSIVLWKNVN